MNLKILFAVAAGITGASGVFGILIGAAVQLSSSTYSHPISVGLLIGLASGLGLSLFFAPLIASED